MKTNSEFTPTNRSTLTRSLRSPKSILAATAATVCLAIFSMTSAHAATQLLSNGNFSSTANNGTIGGNYTSGNVTQVLGSGPWSGKTTGSGHNAPIVLVHGGTNGYGQISNLDSSTHYASIFQSLSSVYKANSTYTLTVDISNSSFTSNISSDKTLLGNDGIGIGLTLGGTATSEGSYLVSSLTNTQVTSLGNGTLQLTLSYTTGNTAPTGNIGVRMFASSTQQCGNNCVTFDNASLTVVPEPSSLALAGIFGFGMLMLFRRYNYAE